MSKKAKKAKQEKNAAAVQVKPSVAPAIGGQLGAALKGAGVGKLADLKRPKRATTTTTTSATTTTTTKAMTNATTTATTSTSTSTPEKERPRARLTAAEVSAFNDAYRGVKPLKRKSVVTRRVPVPEPVKPVFDPMALVADREARERLGALVAGDVKFELQAERDGYVQALRQGTNRKLLTAVQSKSFAPDATLDLHGFRAAEAASRVHDFVRHEHKRGARRLLLIVGKGSHSEDGASVLGPVVREALIRSGAAPLIAAFASAHESLGGRGALAVLLR